ncbi:hypothetical protein VE04_03869 [Pseudogymnoascus sp. 24MN13]|nr:hypothetical protein VE04_03869 [Pseudogymnoascus sp. 24MN13]
MRREEAEDAHGFALAEDAEAEEGVYASPSPRPGIRGSPKNSGPPAGCGVGEEGGSVSQDKVRTHAARTSENVVAEDGS